MTSVPNFIYHPVIQSFLILLLVVMIEKLWTFPDKVHPVSLLRYMGKLLVNKVNKPDNSVYQQKLSGVLTPAIILAPVILLIWLLTSVAEYPLFFDGLMLLMALQFHGVPLQLIKITRLLQANKKSLAREQLQKLVLRDTNNLSSMGIIKTAIEACCLRYCYLYTPVLFWFMCLGGTGALVYRILFELHMEWNPKKTSMKAFGQPLHQLLKAGYWLPLRITLSGLMLFSGVSRGWKALRLSRPRSSHQLTLVVFASALKAQLSGPVMYQGQKYRCAKVGGYHAPELPHLQLCIQLTSYLTLMWLTGTLLISAIVYATL